MANFKFLKNEKDYHLVVERAIEIFDAQPGSADFEELEILGTLIKDYEDKQYQISFQKSGTILPL